MAAKSASLTLSSQDALLKLITESFPNLSLTITVSGEAKASSIKLPAEEVVSGTSIITHYLARQLFPGLEYSEIEEAEIIPRYNGCVKQRLRAYRKFAIATADPTAM
ncbi:hypothetical protein L211DRAFT_835995 [Terfezia boudieri ATCC MYA-4762]|uniref:Uncharacterized protein n=1 Tax=Terfezia boudieri ATCC MYA-4762 TaxID=1051890 RepID=A0A3N4LSQ6_9PEZI|nr:hypothetical protein L211DRAFT_835995 [Terfezia boudieri ATCC MYA-4762]